MNAVREPLRIGAFRRLIAAYAVNALGNWLGQIALAVLVLQRTHSPAAVAAVMIVGQFVPSLLAPVLVARLEPVRRWPVLPCLLTGEALAFACLIGLWRVGSLGLLLALIGIDGLLALAARALLKASIVGVTAPRGLLREGNSILVGVFTVCMAIGPVAAGITIGLFSAATALGVDAASFALAAIILLGCAPSAAGDPKAHERPGRLREAIDYVGAESTLRRLLSAYALLSLASAAILPLEVVLVTRTLGASAAAYGTVLALWGVGATLGSALVPRLRHLPLIPLVATTFVLMAVAYIGMGIAPTVLAVCVFSLIGGVGNGIEGFATMTAIQERTAERFQARVNGLFESITAATCGLGFVTGGLIAVLASTRATYVAAGVAILLVTPLILRARPVPHSATTQSFASA